MSNENTNPEQNHGNALRSWMMVVSAFLAFFFSLTIVGIYLYLSYSQVCAENLGCLYFGILLNTVGIILLLASFFMAANIIGKLQHVAQRSKTETTAFIFAWLAVIIFLGALAKLLFYAAVQDPNSDLRNLHLFGG